MLLAIDELRRGWQKRGVVTDVEESLIVCRSTDSFSIKENVVVVPVVGVERVTPDCVVYLATEIPDAEGFTIGKQILLALEVVRVITELIAPIPVFFVDARWALCRRNISSFVANSDFHRWGSRHVSFGFQLKGARWWARFVAVTDNAPHSVAIIFLGNAVLARPLALARDIDLTFNLAIFVECLHPDDA